jgi:hypothetical protein
MSPPETDRIFALPETESQESPEERSKHELADAEAEINREIGDINLDENPPSMKWLE